jgi:hypothetical protein
MKDSYRMLENRQKIKIKHYRRIGIVMGHETNILGSECITNTQSDTIIHNKIQTDIHGQEGQPNNGRLKKSMIQQILLQRYTYTRKRSCSLDESITEQGLVNDARNTNIRKQILYNT